MDSDKRIQILDFYRGVAVFMVVMYHYVARYSVIRYSDSLYTSFQYGYFGVNLFFILSGIVIYNSLLYSDSISSFLAKRIIRLMPSLIVCSVITYFLVPVIDRSNVFEDFHSRTPIDFLPSLLFIPPVFWNYICDMTSIRYISGSYWSLFPEVVFYISSSIVFFKSSKDNFVRNWLSIVVLANIIRILSSPKLLSNTHNVQEWFFVFGLNYWIYFAFGVYAFKLYKKEKPSWMETGLICFLLLLEMFFLKTLDYQIIVLTIVAMILLGSRFSGVHNTLLGKAYIFLGKVSYPLYLIHEFIGVEIIYYSKEFFNSSLFFLIPVLVFGLAVLVSSWIYKVEEYTIRILKRKLLITRIR